MSRDLKKILDDCNVGMATKGQLKEQEYLEPRLWETLRLRLQSTYRIATGNPQAVLTAENN